MRDLCISGTGNKKREKINDLKSDLKGFKLNVFSGNFACGLHYTITILITLHYWLTPVSKPSVNNIYFLSVSTIVIFFWGQQPLANDLST